jgi:acetyl esterase/lipase
VKLPVSCLLVTLVVVSPSGIVSGAQSTASQAGTPPAGQQPGTQPGGRGGRGPIPFVPPEIPLWDGAAPGALGNEDADRPTVTVYRASRQANGTGIVVMPGGGYGALANDHEGRQIATWLNAQGVTAFVLKYRLGPKYRHPIELGDAQRAIRLARARAAEFDVLPDRIGALGFSAGGHLASTAATKIADGVPNAADPLDRVSSRPDFLVLCYPVISFDPAVGHTGSIRNLLGENPTPAQMAELSNELHVTATTPPTFIFHTNADTGVRAENSVRFFLALREKKVAAEMHIFENGPHGVGLALYDPALSAWPTLLSNWMRGRGLLTRPAAAAK